MGVASLYQLPFSKHLDDRGAKPDMGIVPSANFFLFVVHIVIDDLEFDMTYPVISGSSIIHEMTMSQQKVSTAIQRAFVKGVAIRTGLGFGLWSSENDETADRGVDDISVQDPAKLYKKIGQLFAMKMRQTGMSEEEIGAKIGIDENPGAILGNLCKQLQMYEAKRTHRG